MRRLFFLLLSVFVIAGTATVGCKPRAEGDKPKPRDLEAESRNVGDRYVRGVLGAGNSAKGTVGLTSIQKAIQMYKIQHGKNPKSIDELVDEGFLPMMPKAPPNKKFEYDASAGTVKLVNK